MHCKCQRTMKERKKERKKPTMADSAQRLSSATFLFVLLISVQNVVVKMESDEK